MPVTWARTLGPVVYESHHERGGHFAAHEKLVLYIDNTSHANCCSPHIIARDLQKMFGKGGGAYGAVEGKNGYEKVMARL